MAEELRSRCFDVEGDELEGYLTLRKLINTTLEPLSPHCTDCRTETLLCEPVYDRTSAGTQDRKFSLRSRELSSYYGLYIT